MKTPENENELAEFAHETVKTLLWIANHCEDRKFRVFFIGAIIANVVGNLTEAQWKDFMAVGPCGRPGCDCEKQAAIILPGLNAIRQDHQLHCPPSARTPNK